MSRKKVLIAGASGAVGSAALTHFASLPEWEVVGLSRRPPIVPMGKFPRTCSTGPRARLCSVRWTT